MNIFTSSLYLSDVRNNTERSEHAMVPADVQKHARAAKALLTMSTMTMLLASRNGPHHFQCTTDDATQQYTVLELLVLFRQLNKVCQWVVSQNLACVTQATIIRGSKTEHSCGWGCRTTASACKAVNRLLYIRTAGTM